MSDNKDIINTLTEYEKRLIEIYRGSLFSDTTPTGFIAKVRQIMPPTCSPTERKFLDRVREIGEWVESSEQGDNCEEVENSCIVIVGKDDDYILEPHDFPGINLKELVND
jgi:hypothetical protein